LILLALALGCGLVASIGISQVLDRNRAAEPAGETVEVFVAAVDIPFGDVIKPEMVKLEPWPKDKAPTGVVSKLEDVEGKRPKTKLYAGEPILEVKIGATGADAPSLTVPEGYRIVTVKVTADNGGNLIRVSDRVDVQVFIRQGAVPQITQPTLQTFLRDVRIFAVDQDVNPKEGEEPGGIPKTVSLLVTPRQSEKVNLASRIGDIRLVIRNPDDKSEVADSKGRIGIEQLFDDENSEDRTADMPGQAKTPVAKKGGFADWLKKQVADVSTKAAEIKPNPAHFVQIAVIGPELQKYHFEDVNKPPIELSGDAAIEAAKARRAGAPTKPTTEPADSEDTPEQPEVSPEQPEKDKPNAE
jgi:pilus assembly protein CpaB